jgi:hypothetical protein
MKTFSGSLQEWVESITPNDATPTPDLSGLASITSKWRPAYPLAGYSSLTVVANREYWNLLQWRGDRPATRISAIVTTGAGTNLVIGCYGYLKSGVIGAQTFRDTLNPATAGVKSTTLSVPIMPMQWFWSCLWCDGAAVVNAASYASETPLGIYANSPWGPAYGLYRLSITPAANAAPASPPATTALTSSGSIAAQPLLYLEY